MSDLKPCPFCGDTYIIVRKSRARYFVGCNTINCVACNVGAKQYKTEAEVIKAWNRRARDEGD